MEPDGPLPRAFPDPEMRGRIRTSPEDFVVIERLGFTPAGVGEHLYLRVEKRAANTDWVAGQLARHFRVHRRDIGYAGLKDRHALTQQWFSIGRGGATPVDPAGVEIPGVRILEAVPHQRKLRRGALAGNRFQITVRALDADPRRLIDRLERIARTGVPNYFGEQRFGHGNLAKAQAFLAGRLRKVDRFRRGLYLSAARAMLFNRVLGARVERGDWNRAIDGDAMILAGSHSFFVVETVDDEIRRRVEAGDIHPSGPLWGEGDLTVQGEALRLEQALLQSRSEWCEGLAAAGLRQQRRALRVIPADVCWRCAENGESIRIEFDLPAGCYATAVLREVIAYDSATDLPPDVEES